MPGMGRLRRPSKTQFLGAERSLTPNNPPRTPRSATRQSPLKRGKAKNKLERIQIAAKKKLEEIQRKAKANQLQNSDFILFKQLPEFKGAFICSQILN